MIDNIAPEMAAEIYEAMGFYLLWDEELPDLSPRGIIAFRQFRRIVKEIAGALIEDV